MPYDRYVDIEVAKETLEQNYKYADNPPGYKQQEMDLFSVCSDCKAINNEQEYLGCIYWLNVDEWVNKIVKYPRVAYPLDYPLRSEFLNYPKRVLFYFNDKKHLIGVLYDEYYFWHRIATLSGTTPKEIKDNIEGTNKVVADHRFEQNLESYAWSLAESFPSKTLEQIKDHLRSMKEDDK